MADHTKCAVSCQLTAIYLRISIETEASVSLEAQEDECRALCELKGWQDVVVYLDRSRSASDATRTRPDYRRMMAGVEAGCVIRIVFRDDDRLVRQPVELEQLIDVLDRNRVPLYFAHGRHLDLSTPDGRLTARLAGNMARAEVEKKSARQKSSNRHRVAAGSPIGTVRPLGFKRVRVNGVATFEHVSDEVKAIRWAAEHVKSGGTLSSVAREWTRRGIVMPKTKQPYTWMAVKGALTNPYLAAKIAYQPTSILTRERPERLPKYRADLIPGNWEPILSYEAWTDLVAHVTRVRQRTGNRIKYLLGGVASCGICGGYAKTEWTRTRQGHKKRLYRCKDNRCWILRAERIDRYVTDSVVEMLTAEDLTQESERESPIDRVALGKEREELEADLMKLTDMLTRRALTLPQFERANRVILVRLTEIGDLLSEPEPGELPKSIPATIEAFDAQTIEQRRMLVKAATTAIRIFPAGSTVLPPAAVYVHVYDRRGRLRPLPVGPDEHSVYVAQAEHAKRYGKAVN